jgi:hypothetical protein
VTNGNDKDLKTHYAFLDTQAYSEHRFDWSGKAMEKLAEFAKSGVLKLLTTEVTKREVRSQLSELVAELQDRIQKSRPILQQLGLVHSIADANAATESLFERFEDFLKRSRAKTLPIPSDATSTLNDYFDRRPPFGQRKKKTEFPDAFVIAALHEWCESSGHSVYIISRDPQ